MTSSRISILLGKGDGTFYQHYSIFPVGCFPTSVVAGDFTGDKKMDLVVANFYDSQHAKAPERYPKNTISLLKGFGDGRFGWKKDFSVDGLPKSIATGDFDKDKKLDLAVTLYNKGKIQILLGKIFNLSTRWFSLNIPYFLSSGSYLTGREPNSVVVADFNSDKKLDLAVANLMSDTVSILLGKGNGYFSQAKSFSAVGGYPSSIVVADFNSDKKLDLAVAELWLQLVFVYLGKGNGTFGQGIYSSNVGISFGASAETTLITPSSIAVGHFD